MRRITVRIIHAGHEQFFVGGFDSVDQAIYLAAAVRQRFGCPAWVDDDQRPSTPLAINFRAELDVLIAAELAKKGERSVPDREPKRSAMFRDSDDVR